MVRRRGVGRRLLVGAALVASAVLVGAWAAGAATPPPIPPSASWLQVVNYYRAMAGLAPVVENATWSAGAYQHSCYMTVNGISHDEIPGRPQYSEAGDVAGNSGNVAVTTDVTATDRDHIELWMSGPFHAIGVLRHNVTQMGFGRCTNPNAPSPPSGWRSAATLDVIRGIDRNRARPASPIVFPGNGTTTNLDRFTTESPDPRTPCPGYTSATGLPLIAMMPEPPTGISATISGPNGSLEACTTWGAKYSGVARSIVEGDNAVLVIPRSPLAPGSYRVSVRTDARTVSWSFTVDPAVADGTVTTPAVAPASTSAIAAASRYAPIPPVRLVDSRDPQNVGAASFAAGQTVTVRVAGVRGIPSGVTAVSANVTVAGARDDGWVTVWPCGESPWVSTVNFRRGETVPNAALVPLSPDGAMCLNASSAADVIVDVNGVLEPGATDRFTPVDPSRILDSRSGQGVSGAGPRTGVTRLRVEGRAGVPSGATAVVLNVTAVDPADSGWVTAYDCAPTVPWVSNLNLTRGVTRPNLVVAPLSADGSVCLFSSTATHLLADVAGYLGPSDGYRFTPLLPTRVMDTRERHEGFRYGLDGPLPAGVVVQVPLAGQRGIPAGTRAVSVNVTMVGAAGAGWLTAYPCGADVPWVSTVNTEVAAATANAAQVKLSPSGSMCLVSTVTAHVLLDINGAWT
jgi:hypothetical protein